MTYPNLILDLERGILKVRKKVLPKKMQWRKDWTNSRSAEEEEEKEEECEKKDEEGDDDDDDDEKKEKEKKKKELKTDVFSADIKVRDNDGKYKGWTSSYLEIKRAILSPVKVHAEAHFISGKKAFVKVYHDCAQLYFDIMEMSEFKSYIFALPELEVWAFLLYLFIYIYSVKIENM